MFWLIPLCLGFALLCVFLVFRVIQRRVIAVIFKGLVSLMFILTAFTAFLVSKSPNMLFATLILLGLFFGLLGDIFLDLKFIILSREMMYTILGFIAFGIGHIFFLTGLFVNFYDYASSVWYILVPVIITLVLVVVTLLMEKFSKIRYQKMKPFVIIYGFILFLTVTMYMSVAIQSRWQVTTVWVMAISLILFALSDLILNNTYFAPGFNTPVFIISNHVFYYLAQFGIAMSLLFLV